jgi:hypothetical protein
MKKPTRRVDTVFIHCSASDNPGHDDITVVRRWHIDRGFKDIGYHFFIRASGEVQDGRSLEDTPAAQAGHNTGSIAICLHGKTLGKFTPAQFNALRDLCHDIQRLYATPLRFRGHREVAAKSCPVFDYKQVLGLDEKGFLTTINIKKGSNMKISLPNLRQPSTWQGLTGLTGAIGMAVEPALLEQIITIVTAIVSLISIFKDERGRG